MTLKSAFCMALMVGLVLGLETQGRRLEFAPFPPGYGRTPIS